MYVPPDTVTGLGLKFMPSTENSMVAGAFPPRPTKKMPPSSVSAQVASKMPVPDVDKLTLMGVGLVMAMLLLDCWMHPLLSVAQTDTV